MFSSVRQVISSLLSNPSFYLGQYLEGWKRAMNTKKLLVGCAFGCLALLLLLAVGGYFGYRYYVKPQVDEMLGQSEDIGPAGVVVGQGLLQPRVFFSDPGLGVVTDISVGKLDPTPGAAVGVAGEEGAVFLDQSGAAVSSVKFTDSYDRIVMVDVEGDGVCEFMDRGSWGSEAALLDHRGQKLWSYGGKGGGVNDMGAGDVDNDGMLEFAVGFNGGGGVHLLDRAGRVRWQRPDANVWNVGMADLNGDGRAEIVHSNAGGQLIVRDELGNIVSQTRQGAKPASRTQPLMPGFFHFSLCPWPASSSPARVLASGRDTVEVFDAAGKTLATLDAPRVSYFSDVIGVPMRLRKDAPEHYAVAVTFQLAEKSAL